MRSSWFLHFSLREADMRLLQWFTQRAPQGESKQRRFRPQVEGLEERWIPSTTKGYLAITLVANEEGEGRLHDDNLVNAWGLALSPTGGNFWVSDNGTDVVTLYSGDVNGTPLSVTSQLPVVTVPGGKPTG